MKKLLPELKQFNWWIVGATFGIALGAMADLWMPLLLSNIIDVGIPSASRSAIWGYGGQMLFVAAISLAGAIFGNYCAAYLGAGLSKSMRAKVFDKVQTFSLEEVDSFGPASLITRNTNDIDAIQRFVMMTVKVFVRFPILLIGGTIMAVSKSPRLAKPLLITIPLIIVTIFIVSRYIIPLFKVMQTKLDAVNRVLREQITGIRVSRAFGTENHETERFDEVSSDYTQTGLRMMRTMSILNPLLSVIMHGTIIFVLVLSTLDVNAGILINNGTTVAIVQYLFQIMFALIMLSMVFIVYPRAVASNERIYEILDTQPKIVDLKHTKTPHEDVKGVVEFRNVGFTFPDAEKATIENLSVKVNKGETLAIIGSTGSGKSTLLRLVMRFYDVTQGSILVDGVDIRDMSQKDLRSRIGYVPQQSLLFSGTIEENLGFGKSSPSYGEMETAAKTAQAYEFIQDENGVFDAHVARSGNNFSGGQKQRISITRAVIRQPEILLFDDSFSALDAATDLKLRRALKKDVGEITQIVIAQRVASISEADNIIVLDNGRVEAQGTHQELLKTSPIYKEIADSQFSEEEVAI